MVRLSTAECTYLPTYLPTWLQEPVLDQPFLVSPG